MKQIPHFLLKLPFFAFSFIFWIGALSCSTDGMNNDTPMTEATQDSVLTEGAKTEGLKDIDPLLKIGATFRFDTDPKYLGITENEFNTSQVLFYAGFGG